MSSPVPKPTNPSCNRSYSDYWIERPFESLLGVTLVRIDATLGSDVVVFEDVEGYTYRMTHYQDCCENVQLEDMVGDIEDLLHHPILLAEETSQIGDSENQDSATWTFYKLATVKGYVTFRWFGESNGYYSESVEFEFYAPQIVDLNRL